MPGTQVFARMSSRTHMPFLAGDTLVFCASEQPIMRQFTGQGRVHRVLAHRRVYRGRFAAEDRVRPITYRAWKLFACEWGDRIPRRIQTGLPAECIECSPSYFTDADSTVLTFIGGVPTGEAIIYHLYRMSGPSLDELGPCETVVDHPTRIGFENSKYICTGDAHQLYMYSKSSGEQEVLQMPFDLILRATFVADEPDRLLVTGQGPGPHAYTLAYDTSSDDAKEVECDGPVYKCSLAGNRIVFAAEDAGELEGRELRHGQVRLKSTERTVRRRH